MGGTFGLSADIDCQVPPETVNKLTPNTFFCHIWTLPQTKLGRLMNITKKGKSHDSMFTFRSLSTKTITMAETQQKTPPEGSGCNSNFDKEISTRLSDVMKQYCKVSLVGKKRNDPSMKNLRYVFRFMPGMILFINN